MNMVLMLGEPAALLLPQVTDADGVSHPVWHGHRGLYNFHSSNESLSTSGPQQLRNSPHRECLLITGKFAQLI